MVPMAPTPLSGTTLLMATLLSLLALLLLLLAIILNHSVVPATRPAKEKVVPLMLLPTTVQAPVVWLSLEILYSVAPVTGDQLKFNSPAAQDAVVVRAVGVPRM